MKLDEATKQVIKALKFSPEMAIQVCYGLAWERLKELDSEYIKDLQDTIINSRKPEGN